MEKMKSIFIKSEVLKKICCNKKVTHSQREPKDNLWLKISNRKIYGKKKKKKKKKQKTKNKKQKQKQMA